jgi:cytochrome c
MLRIGWVHVLAAGLLALAALLLVRLHNASGASQQESIANGRRLAEIWCKNCHAFETPDTPLAGRPPDFTRIANRPSSIESIKVFLRKDHARMPNFTISGNQSEELAQFIMSLKRD